ncbi:hypothetical protein LVJ94_22070 [Pendulispora rubella]|uniref:Uncharacterized protein n=1 Tax=Pendulispora rubella TaxID=2741070 RepID=A0ABZ2LGN3_9BACT
MRGQDLLDLTSVLLSLFGSAAVVFAIVRWDERRLPDEQLERAWPGSTRLLAPLAFGPMCLPVHFWRTRRSVLGTLLGVVYAAAVLLLNFVLVSLLEQLLI